MHFMTDVLRALAVIRLRVVVQVAFAHNGAVFPKCGPILM